MGFTYRHAISVVQLIIFIPSLLPSLIFIWRHGFSRNAGFLFLVIFCLLRIVGAICDLVTISDPSSTGLYITSAVCSSIALSPLIMLCSGLLSRVNTFIPERSGLFNTSLLLRLLRLVSIAGAILSIVAFTENMSMEALKHPGSLIKIAMILFIVAWVLLLLALAILTRHVSVIQAGERRILLAVGLSAAFILVRLIYAILIWFATSSVFNLYNGNNTAMLIMSVMPEFAITIVCLVIGLTLHVQEPVAVEEQRCPDFKPSQGAPTREYQRVQGLRYDSPDGGQRC